MPDKSIDDRISVVSLSGAERIASERQRQIDREHYDARHDDCHMRGELVMAAVAYAGTAIGEQVYVERDGVTSKSFIDPWPWDEDDDKRPACTPTHEQRVRLLEKAGALIAAEIDRLLLEKARGYAR